MTGRLQNKVALITGGCSGIGLATAELFIREGARVVVADILMEQGAELEERFGSALRFAPCDVIEEQQVAAAVALAEEAFGGLDITFNNAGITGYFDGIENTDAEKWDRTLNICLRGVMFGIKHSAPAMKKRGGGAIINTASASGGATFGAHDYCASKAAVIHMSRVTALELAPFNIRVNSISPGIVPTPIFGQILGLPHEQAESLAKTISEKTASLQPIPRAGKPSDIAEACLFLSSDAASWITGIDLRVDGGVTLIPQIDMNHEKPGTYANLVFETAQGLAGK